PQEAPARRERLQSPAARVEHVGAPPSIREHLLGMVERTARRAGPLPLAERRPAAGEAPDPPRALRDEDGPVTRDRKARRTHERAAARTRLPPGEQAPARAGEGVDASGSRVEHVERFPRRGQREIDRIEQGRLTLAVSAPGIDGTEGLVEDHDSSVERVEDVRDAARIARDGPRLEEGRGERPLDRAEDERLLVPEEERATEPR